LTDFHEYDCETCGLCCIEYGGELGYYQEDIARWKSEDETDILVRIGIKVPDAPCTFLSGEPFRCTIYKTRPLVCRHFVNGGTPCLELRVKHGLSVYAAA
jgi:Fe-S-cluster containining protein